MFARTLLVTYVMVRLVEYGIQKLTVDPTFPKEWGVDFGRTAIKWKKLWVVVATSRLHASKYNISQLNFVFYPSNPQPFCILQAGFTKRNTTLRTK